MSAVILTILAQIVAGLPELEAAVQALVAMESGQKLTPEQLQALGAAMEAAHLRAQGGAAAAVASPAAAG